jgi:membrane-associated protease RseP (regulator of RpoE activity)
MSEREELSSSQPSDPEASLQSSPQATLQPSDADYSQPSADVIEPEASAAQPLGLHSLLISCGLFGLTFLSTTYVGSLTTDVPGPHRLSNGLAYAVPLMTILLAHELGHYIAARIHRVPASPPFFVPLPLPPFGTLGAVILMPGRIAKRNALLDIGAAGPLAGLLFAIPILIYGLMTSPVVPDAPGYAQEGRSLLYGALLLLTKGGLAPGQDILLNATAFAGWTGLLVTMINLIPAAQLDGGHVAFALFGERQERYSSWVRRALLPVAALVSLYYGLSALFSGKHGEELAASFAPGMHWLLWWFLLRLMVRNGRREHPPTDLGGLTPVRRAIAIGTLLLFPLLFMPAWLR